MEMVIITAEIIAETELAILVYDGDIEAWLPKSQIDYVDGPGLVYIEMPRWLAEDKELI